MKRISNPHVARVFNRYPKKMKQKLMRLRELIFDVAAKTKDVGQLEETLKWGEPAYLTSQTKSGSLIRIDAKKNRPVEIRDVFPLPDKFGWHLQDYFFPDTFFYEKNRVRGDERSDFVHVSEGLSPECAQNVAHPLGTHVF